MSLLMDALRKAEQEKKKAAKNLRDKEGEIALDGSSGEQGKVISDKLGEASSEHPITRLNRTISRSKDEIFAATSELSLEPISEQQKRQVEADDKKISTQNFSEDVTMNIPIDRLSIDQQGEDGELEGRQGLKEDQTIAEGLGVDGAVSPFDETFHGVDLDKDNIPGLYDETMQGEPYDPNANEHSYDETLPGVPAALLAKDLGDENQPTPVAAQTVFTAGGTTSRSSAINWPLLTAAVVIVVVATGVIVYNYTTPVDRNTLSPLVARGIENLAPPPLAQIEQPSSSIAETASTTTSSPVEGSQSVDSLVAENDQSIPQSTEPATDDKLDSEPLEQVVADESLVVDELVDADEELLNVDEDNVLDDTELASTSLNPISSTQVDPALIRISRSKVPDDRGLKINDAYAAYKTGNLELAQDSYLDVLKNFPDNRDALLGLGAIAMAKKDLAQVFEIYRRLALIDPRDAIARAALISIQNRGDIAGEESAIKLMLHDNPEGSYLYFTLGNIYASQDRWAEAQQAFFDAYRIESNNPDYALNLAISLDHISQTASAIDYYQTALKLADASAAGFDKESVSVRIQTLSVEP